MTPKEKAIELVDKLSIQYALIAVEEILSAHLFDLDEKYYWQQVKQNLKKMENKTAVQIFFDDLCHLGYIEYPDENLVQDRLNLALEIEKQQIINAFLVGDNECVYNEKDAEEYYSETYKKPTE